MLLIFVKCIKINLNIFIEVCCRCFLEKKLWRNSDGDKINISIIKLI